MPSSSSPHTYLVCLEQLCNVCADLFDLKVPAVSLHRLAILIEKELFEIPSNVGSAHWGPRNDGAVVETATVKNQRIPIITAVFLGITCRIHRVREALFQPLEQGMGCIPIHI